jgi:hypothetical protein
MFTRIAVSKTKQSGIAVPRSAEHVLSYLCKAVAKALNLIRDYRVKWNEILLEIDSDSLLSDELKAKSAYKTKLFANTEKGVYDHKLTD